MAAIVAWSAPPKSPDRVAASRELAIEDSGRRGPLVPPVPTSVTKRTAIPASSTTAATARRCFLGVGATSVLRSSVSGARRRVAARLVAASRARSAVPLGRRCASVLEVSTAAPAALSFTRRMSSSIASPPRLVVGADSEAVRSSRSPLADTAGLLSLPGPDAAEPSSFLGAPSVMRPRSRSRAAPADWPPAGVPPFTAGGSWRPFRLWRRALSSSVCSLIIGGIPYLPCRIAVVGHG
jgi:hypothetical protein